MHNNSWCSGELLQKIELFIRRHINQCDEHVAVAYSGGCDSTALLLLLGAACERLSKNLVVIQVVLRQLERPRLELPESLGMKTICVVDDLSPSASKGQARQRLRKHLMEQCRKNGIKHLFMGHHAQDQAETVWMRALRGSCVSGLCGIRQVTQQDGVCILRPFLDTSRSQLEYWLWQKSVSYFSDPKNEDVRFERNRHRKLIEQLSEDIGLNVSANLCTLASRMQQIQGHLDLEYLEWMDLHKPFHIFPEGFIRLTYTANGNCVSGYQGDYQSMQQQSMQQQSMQQQSMQQQSMQQQSMQQQSMQQQSMQHQGTQQQSTQQQSDYPHNHKDSYAANYHESTRQRQSCQYSQDMLCSYQHSHKNVTKAQGDAACDGDGLEIGGDVLGIGGDVLGPGGSNVMLRMCLQHIIANASGTSHNKLLSASEKAVVKLAARKNFTINKCGFYFVSAIGLWFICRAPMCLPEPVPIKKGHTKNIIWDKRFLYECEVLEEGMSLCHLSRCQAMEQINQGLYISNCPQIMTCYVLMSQPALVSSDGLVASIGGNVLDDSRVGSALCVSLW